MQTTLSKIWTGFVNEIARVSCCDAAVSSGGPRLLPLPLV